MSAGTDRPDHPDRSDTNGIRDVHLKVACLHLRHKLMYVDERQSTPGLVDDQSDTRVYFCISTQDQLGPDDDPVHPCDCTPERGCYRKA